MFVMRIGIVLGQVGIVKGFFELFGINKCFGVGDELVGVLGGLQCGREFGDGFVLMMGIYCCNVLLG